MAEYLVLARKYRSTTFDEVVGQEPVAQTLKNAIATGRIAHAYLFTGTRGVGKTTMSRILAKALNCLSFDGPTPTPCNICDACVAIARGDDVDVVEIDGASNRGIDEIRELRANAIFKPSRSRYKIFYIDEVHMLTKEAFNALLKTLEEPPAHVKFIFATTETEKVPATILSRCQKFDFRNIPTRDIAGHLAALCQAEGVPAEPAALFRIARAASGSMRDALSLMDQLLAASGERVTDADVVRILGTPGDERTMAIVAAIARADAAGALTELDAVLESGVTLPSAVASLGDAMRNMMVALVCGPGSELIELPELQRQAVAELAKGFTVPSLVQAIGMWQTVARNIRSSSVARPLVEAAIVRLAESDKFIDPQSLLERLGDAGPGRGSESGGGGRPASAGGPGGAGAGSWTQKKNLTSPGPAAGPAFGRDATAYAPSGTNTTYAPAGPATPAATTPGSPGAYASGVSQAPAESSAPPAGPGEGLVWEAAWLRANWRKVVDALIARRQMPLVGVLGVAKVMDFRDGTLRLDFDAQHAALRPRCTGDLLASMNTALSALADGPVRCDFGGGVAIAGASGGAAAGTPTRATFGDLSVEEKSAVMKDPAIRTVLDLFGGDVVNVKRQDTGTQQTGQEEDAETEG